MINCILKLKNDCYSLMCRAVYACVCQDPVYGKGKLAEIQGLILGMLDTFNYEQVKLFVFGWETNLMSS